MKLLSKTSAKVALLISSVLVAGVAMADPAAVPTTAVGLAQSVDLSDAKGGGLVIIGLLIGVGVTLWGANLVLSRFRPK